MKEAFSKPWLISMLVPLVLAVTLVPYSTLLGWNLVTFLLFWFLLVPIIALLIPALIYQNTKIEIVSLIGLSIFYASMVIMIYQQHQTDFFRLMMMSYIINLLWVLVIPLLSRKKFKFI